MPPSLFWQPLRPETLTMAKRSTRTNKRNRPRRTLRTEHLGIPIRVTGPAPTPSPPASRIDHNVRTIFSACDAITIAITRMEEHLRSLGYLGGDLAENKSSPGPDVTLLGAIGCLESTAARLTTVMSVLD